ncbi:MAG: bifunctional phosphoglucose/phosphomannose isomerase [Chloroflexota bacterium]
MINLDDFQQFEQFDPQRMIDHIDGLPDQLEHAWQLGSQFTFPAMPGIRQVLVAGMGGSAIGADLLGAYLEPLAKVPYFVQRDYNLPRWASGEDTLVVASSHSGNTEETLSVFEQAVRTGCRTAVISTGGRLAALAREYQLPLWQFEHAGQPRAAVGYSFGLLLAMLTRLQLLPDTETELKDAIAQMRTQQKQLRAMVPVPSNPAKRLAGQLLGRWVTVMGSGILAPVARRWKGQISEVAKAWAQFEFLPEADHNTVAGVDNPEALLAQSVVIFLQAASEHPQNTLRSNLTRQTLMLAGLGTDFHQARGDTRLAQVWTTLHFGDYVAYYLAMAYGVDPTPVPAIESLKAAMKQAGEPV